MDRPQRKYLGLLVLAALLAATMLLWPRRERRSPTSTPQKASPPASVELDTMHPDRRARPETQAPSSRQQHPDIPDEPKSSAQQHIERYLKAKQYPPGSGRLTRGHYGLLNWNTRYEKPLPVPDAQGKPEDEQVFYIFTTDRYFYEGDQIVHARLGAWKGSKPIAITILDAWAKREDRAGLTGQAVPLLFTERSLTYRSNFAPAMAFPDHHGNILLDVMFEYAEGEVHHAKLRLFFTPTDRVPARFTGQFTDAVEQGSLVIRAGIVVKNAGFYIISANLFDAFDNPVAFTTFKGTLTPEDTEVPILFFGKLFHDANASAPYVMANLRGYRFLDGHYPDRERMNDHGGTYTTGHYQLDEFYEEDWTSDQKEWMLDQLYKMAEDGEEFPVAATPGTEAPPPAP